MEFWEEYLEKNSEVAGLEFKVKRGLFRRRTELLVRAIGEREREFPRLCVSICAFVGTIEQRCGNV